MWQLQFRLDYALSREQKNKSGGNHIPSLAPCICAQPFVRKAVYGPCMSRGMYRKLGAHALKFEQGVMMQYKCDYELKAVYIMPGGGLALCF